MCNEGDIKSQAEELFHGLRLTAAVEVISGDEELQKFSILILLMILYLFWLLIFE